jgi:hypothetical protein
MSLFRLGDFKLHSGGQSDFKIECEGLDDDDLDAIAYMLAKLLPPFGLVEGVPHGGLGLAQAMSKWAGGPPNRLLIVDDVLTTGASMEEQREGRDAYGAVIFARGPCASWILPLFTMTGSGIVIATDLPRKSFEDVPMF